MLLTVTTTHRPATDLGFLLRKNPARAQRFSVSSGVAHVVYPEADEQRCTAALLLEVDPVALVRGHGEGGGLAAYVDDAPWACASLLAVALGQVFRSAVAGRCAERPDLVGTPLPLELALPAVPASGGPRMVERLFAPLGWQVTARPIPLDPARPGWGARHVQLRLVGQATLAAALRHLYVLLPVLDDDKHYWVDRSEVDKLIRAGEGWLAGHPSAG